MPVKPYSPRFAAATKARNVFFVLLGVAGLLFKRSYAGPFQEVVRSYGGNFVVSFAVYFVLINLPFHSRFGRLLTAGVAVGVVELFEVLDGFGVMSNVYDPIDLVANAVGVALALAVDTALRPRQQATTTAQQSHPR